MSRACASRAATSLLAFAGGISFIREADLDRERQRVGVVQPRLAVGELHHVGEPGERQERDGRSDVPARDLLQPQLRAPVVDLRPRPATRSRPCPTSGAGRRTAAGRPATPSARAGTATPPRRRWRAGRQGADAPSARPSRSAWSVQRAISFAPIASSWTPRPRSLRLVDARNRDSTPPDSCAPHRRAGRAAPRGRPPWSRSPWPRRAGRSPPGTPASRARRRRWRPGRCAHSAAGYGRCAIRRCTSASCIRIAGERDGDVGGERLAFLRRGELVRHRGQPEVRPRVRCR